MTFNLTLYTPSHYWWKLGNDAWFYRPDENSSGGTGIKVRLWFVGIYVSVFWGHR